jgi:putative ABC transport system permease protein
VFARTRGAGGALGEGTTIRRHRTNPLWRKAPLVLLRYPGLFVALAAGALLLAVAASLYPLYLSASATGLVRAETDTPTVTRYGSGLSYRNGTMRVPGMDEQHPVAARVGALFDRITADPNLEPAEMSVNGPVVQVASADRPDATRSVHLFAGAQARANVTVIEGGDPGGAWVPDLVAGPLGIHRGDTIVVTSQSGRDVRLPVTGIYSSLYKGAASGYWHPWYDDFVVYCGNCAPPPQPLLVPADRLEPLAAALDIGHAAYAWVAPARPELTLPQVREVAARARAITQRMAKAGTPEHDLLGRCYAGFFCNPRNGPQFASSAADVVTNVDRRLTTIEGPARLLRAAGMLVALVVVAAAGAFSVSARRVEATLLDARGFGPAAAGLRGALEAVVPSTLGALAGLGLGAAGVAWLGPGRVDAVSWSDAIRSTVVAAAVAIASIGVVSAVAFVTHPGRDRARRSSAGAIPWEVALAALSIWALVRLRSGGAFQVDPATRVETPTALLLVFPVLFLAGFVTLVARAFGFGARWLRARAARMGSPLSLAVHRLAGAPGLTVLLVGASGLCLGLFVQSQTVVRSISTTVHAKAELYVGSDVEARIEYTNTMPERFPLPLTRVTRRIQAGTLVPSRNRFGDPFDLLAIDPSTFASTAYWNSAFADQPLADLLRPLSTLQGDRVPVLVVAGSSTTPTAIAIDQLQVPVVVVGRASSFPGVTSLRPLLVVSEHTLLEAVGNAPNPLSEVGASTELWIRGDPVRAQAALAADLPYQPDLIVTANEVQDIPYIAATIQTFEVMNWLGLGAALLVIAAMLMYLQARQRSQVVSYGLSLRMGMPSAAHRRALVAELGAMLGLAFVVGATLGLVASRLVVPLLDPLPKIPPAPLFLVPVVVLLIAAPAVAVVVAGGAWLTELRARRTDLGQVMRIAE